MLRDEGNILMLQFGNSGPRPHYSPEKSENATITGQFGYVFEENSGRKIT